MAVDKQADVNNKNKEDISYPVIHCSFPSEIERFRVVRRNGKVTPFDPSKISIAIMKAFVAVEGKGAAVSNRAQNIIKDLTEQTVAKLLRHSNSNSIVHIEEIQDQVELSLMRSEYYKIAKAYLLYRKERSSIRESEMHRHSDMPVAPNLKIKMDNGEFSPLDSRRMETVVIEACEGLDDVSSKVILSEIYKNLYDGLSDNEVEIASIFTARSLIEKEPNYAKVSARLLLDKLRREVLTTIYQKSKKATHQEMTLLYKNYFLDYIKKGIAANLLHPSMESFDLTQIANAIRPELDLAFEYLGLQTLYDRYFLHIDGSRIEMPQAFFMRVAMGIALKENEKEKRAIEFYNLISSFCFMCSTPTLFNSGTLRPQLSSCFLTTVPDNLDGIFESIKDNALLAKYSGGIGNDWTQVRGLGAHICGTNGKSQGVVPFLKVANDTAVAVNQGGKRKGAVCAYLEIWHLDINEFLTLRKNTGDDRRRTHDMNTANWIPDLFMKRMKKDEMWTLFSPDEVSDLHDLYGMAFEKAYVEYEKKADQGKIKMFRRVSAVSLWRKMLTMLFETGHPWITFKDPCNIRSPQQHSGVVHSSNLCTEITLNTSEDEVAVCNLGSLNLVAHLDEQEKLDYDKLAQTIRTAVRMLDNVIDVNWYTIKKTSNFNQKHRPVGLGLMGFQSVLQVFRIPYESKEAIDFADQSMEFISFHAISSSVDLAEERGRYNSFEGSLWSKGILPIDSIQLLSDVRDDLKMDQSSKMDWSALRERIKHIGMRNSNCLAIAPTATIANICGISQSIEPFYQNLFVKSNMSGDFTVVNANLVNDLKKLDLWDDAMISDLKYYDGSIGNINRIPNDLKKIYATSFEIDPIWLIEAASRRQKWIDQSQSLNLYLSDPSGKKLDLIYKHAFDLGVKTTYYLRSRSATHVEKSTLKGVDGKLSSVSIVDNNSSPHLTEGKSFSCKADDLECESCQ